MTIPTLIIILVLIVLIFTDTIKINITNNENEGFENQLDSKPKSKIAFCFLTVGDINKHNVWETFLKGNEHLYNIYVHPKYPNKVTSFFKNYIIPSHDQIPTEWGKISLVKATIKLLQNAIKDQNNKMIILVSDSCIPIYNFDYIYNDLISQQNNIISMHNQQNIYTHLRYKQISNPKFIPHHKFKKVSQWMALNYLTANYIVKNDYTNLYKDMSCPDEHYFVNILDKFDIPYNTRKLTFDDWDNPSLDPKYRPYPKTFTELNNNNLRNARRTGALFIRKVAPETSINLSELLIQSNDVHIITK
uniref:Nucleotide-diphospho-sugar transferase domain-containing protein n=1 Tax=viral metagenome TaxID=1070528 RepID=A0A6C0E800_9ZZZZ